MRPGSYAFIPPAAKWSVRNTGATPVRFHWIRKGYQAVEGLPYPEAFVTNENDIEPIPMPGTDGKWVTTRFVDRATCHDMHVNIVTFEPGAVILRETHVMEHGLYVRRQGGVSLESGLGRGRGGRLHVAARVLSAGLLFRRPGKFRYLLYKDVNRHTDWVVSTSGPDLQCLRRRAPLPALARKRSAAPTRSAASRSAAGTVRSAPAPVPVARCGTWPTESSACST